MEHLLDIYARAPESLSEADRDRIDALLAEHAGLRDYLDYLTEFYRSFRKLSIEDVPDHVRSFADSLVRLPQRVPLRPPTSRSDRSVSGSAHRFLHADSLAVPESIRALGSLVCTDFGVLVRLIEDRETGELRGYVLSPDQNDAARSLILFDDFDIACATDKSGVFRIPLTDLDTPEELLSGPVELVLPVAEFTVGASGLSDDSALRLFESESMHVDVRRVPTGIEVRVSSGKENAYLVIDATGLQSLHRLADESTEFETVLNTDEFTARLYAG